MKRKFLASRATFEGEKPLAPFAGSQPWHWARSLASRNSPSPLCPSALLPSVPPTPGLPPCALSSNPQRPSLRTVQIPFSTASCITSFSSLAVVALSPLSSLPSSRSAKAAARNHLFGSVFASATADLDELPGADHEYPRHHGNYTTPLLSSHLIP